jgi:hypothetical protein
MDIYGICKYVSFYFFPFISPSFTKFENLEFVSYYFFNFFSAYHIQILCKVAWFPEALLFFNSIFLLFRLDNISYSDFWSIDPFSWLFCSTKGLSTDFLLVCSCAFQFSILHSVFLYNIHFFTVTFYLFTKIHYCFYLFQVYL